MMLAPLTLFTGRSKKRPARAQTVLNVLIETTGSQLGSWDEPVQIVLTSGIAGKQYFGFGIVFSPELAKALRIPTDAERDIG